MKRNIIIVVFLTLLMGFFLNVVDADSGWDSSYDIGGSFDNDSWDSSSFDNDYGSGVYIGGDYSSDDSIGFVIIGGIIIFIIVYSIIHSRRNFNDNVTNINSHNYSDMSDDKIKMIDASIDSNELKNEAFSIYKSVQEAWMNFDYDELRKYTTDEMFNMYESQLKVLKIKNQKNIMKDIMLNDIKIVDISIDNGIEKVVLYLDVNQYDYVIDNNGKVLRGVDKYKNRVLYLITLVRGIDNKKVLKCPNCGANVDINSGGVCPYCDSTIVNSSNQFVISKKECIDTRRV